MNKIILCFFVSQMAFAADFDESVDNSNVVTLEQANAKIEDLFKNSKVIKKEIFCVKKELTCRTHYTLADLNGQVLKAFYVRFVAVDRSVGGNGYFFPVKGETNKYIRFEDFSYDGKVNVNSVEQKNVVRIEKNQDGSLQGVYGVLVPKLGTTKITRSDIIVSVTSTVLDGLTTDSADPTFSEQTHIEYLRTEVTN